MIAKTTCLVVSHRRMPHVDRCHGQRVCPCSTDNYTSDRDSITELLSSFILEKYTLFVVCGLRSPSFEPITVLYITPMDNASMQELVLQEHKQKLCKTCSCCKNYSWHVESKHILQHPKYLSIIVNRFNFINNKILRTEVSYICT